MDLRLSKCVDGEIYLAKNNSIKQDRPCELYDINFVKLLFINRINRDKFFNIGFVRFNNCNDQFEKFVANIIYN